MSDNPFAKPGHNPDVRPSAEERADVPRDGYGRYLVKLPGMEHMPSAPVVPLTRVSTITKALIQKKSIIDWRERLIVEAAADPANAELLVAIRQAGGDRKELKRIGEELFKRGGGKDRSLLGTAMHDFTERRNRGENLTEADMPEEHRPSLRAYEALLADRVRILPGFLERRILAPWSAGGTLDNIVMYRNDLLQPEGSDGDATGEWDMRVADLKTGRDLSKGWPEKLIQLWEYANSEYIWNDETQTWERMPRELRKDRGLIIHVPMDGTAHLYDVDLSGMDKVVEAAMIARRHEAEAHTKATMVASVDMRGPAYVAPTTEDQGVTITLPPPLHTAEEVTQSVVTAFRKAKEDGCQVPIGTGAVSAPGPQLSGTGKSLEPIGKHMDPPRRGCGVCGRIGHKRGNPICLGDADPGNLSSGETVATGQMPDDTSTDVAPVSPVDKDVVAFAGQKDVALSRVFNGQGTAGVDYQHQTGCPLNPERWPHSECPNPEDRCSCVPDRAGFTNRGDGVFVHATCGLRAPAPPVTVQMEPAVTLNRTDGSVAGVVGQPLAGPPITGTELSDPPATVQGWVVDWVVEDIRQAQNQKAVLKIRELAISRGAWNPELHDPIGKARYAELSPKGTNQ